MEHGTCPNCEKKVIFEKEPEFGLHVLCETCQTESVITWLNPIELELIDYEEFQTDEEFEEFEDFEEYENHLQYGKFAAEEEVETFQKIKKKNKGGYNGSRQNQEN